MNSRDNCYWQFPRWKSLALLYASDPNLRKLFGDLVSVIPKSIGKRTKRPKLGRLQAKPETRMGLLVRTRVDRTMHDFFTSSKNWCVAWNEEGRMALIFMGPENFTEDIENKEYYFYSPYPLPVKRVIRHDLP